MKERRENVGGAWKDEGDGFFSLIGSNISPLAYVKLPKGHPDFNKDYNGLNPIVNGGLTFGVDGIFGWDYAHIHNDFNIDQHIKNALRYFKKRLKKLEKK